MGEMQPSTGVAMIPMFNHAIVNYPVYVIKPDEVDTFKARWDGSQPGLEWFPLDEIIDLRGLPPQDQL